MAPGEEMCLRLWLHTGVLGITRTYRAVAKAYPDLGEAFEAVKRGERIAFSMLTDRIFSNLKAGTEMDLTAYLDRLDALKADCVFEDDGAYPERLLELGADKPPVLYFKGRLEREMALPIAIIGSRSCSKYGKDAAMLFANELASRGAVIISGLADGIDSYAAKGALSCKESAYPTIGVTGCGIDRIYPAGNQKLYEDVMARGCVISEFPPGTDPLAGNFPIRNRIISGLSRGVLVVEAREKSGTSITAGLALEQGRDVFALPGRIIDPESAGTNRMIAHGEARMVLKPDDIISEYVDDLIRFAQGSNQAEKQTVERTTLTAEENCIIDALLSDDRSFDELIALTGLTAAKLSAVLTKLEFGELLEQLPGRIYRLDTLRHEWH